MSTYVMPSGAIKCTLPATTGNVDTLPFYINGSGLPAAFWSASGVYRSDGKDIVITSTTGDVLPMELLEFNKASGIFRAWAKAPSVIANTPYEFLIQYGSGIYVEEPSSSVWNNVFGSVDSVAVYHFDETDSYWPTDPYAFGPSNGATAGFSQAVKTNFLLDSSKYVNNGSVLVRAYYGTGSFGGKRWDWREHPETASTLISTSPYGRGRDGQGVYDQGMIPLLNDAPQLSFPDNNNGNPVTMTWVVKYGSRVRLITKNGVDTISSQTNYGEYDVTIDNTNLYVRLGKPEGSTSIIYIEVANSVPLNAWNIVSVSYDGSRTVQGVKIYVNGQEKTITNSSFDVNTYEPMTDRGRNCSLFHTVGMGSPGVYGADPGNVEFDEFFIFPKVLTSSETSAFHNYLVTGLSYTSATVATPVTPSTMRPVFTTQPASVGKNVGDFHTFTAVASGIGNINYQWFKDNVYIEDQIDTDYFIPYISTNSSGVYKVSATNEYGTTYSNNATLSILGPGDGIVRYSGSTHRASGVIPHAWVQQNDVNVPVPISLTTMDPTFWNNTYRIDGKDIVITSVDGVPYEREMVEFNKTSKKCLMWVKFPSLSSSVDTPYLIQYGSSTLNYPNSKTVWSNNYSGGYNHRVVLHYQANGLDSSPYGNNAIGRINHQAPTQSDVPMLFVNGTTDIPTGGDNIGMGWAQNRWTVPGYGFAYIPDNPSLSFATASGDLPMTIRTWMWVRGPSPDTIGPAGKWDCGSLPNTNPTTQYSAFTWTDLPIMCKGNNSIDGEYFFGTVGDRLTFYTVDSRASLGINPLNWAARGAMSSTEFQNVAQGTVCFAATYNGTPTASGYKLYNGGEPVAATTFSGNYGSGNYTAMKDYTYQLELGRAVYADLPNVYNYAWDVIWDETFILQGEMSANQLKTQYNLEYGYNDHTFTTPAPFNTSGYIPPNVETAPSIVVGPSDVTAFLNQSAYFSVNAVGTAPLQYLWKHNGEIISGANSYLYGIDNVQAANAGLYEVGVYNSFGIVYDSATLTVVTGSGIVPNPSGSVPPSSGVVPSGEIPSGSGVIPPDIIYTPVSDYRFIEKSYQGYKAVDAPAIFNLNIGNLYYDSTHEDKVYFGNTSGVKKHQYLWIGGLNSSVYNNLSLSLDRENWDRYVEFDIENNEMKSIYMKYAVEDNPTLGYGTLVIKVAEHG
jgi:hypothetical protein